ncbi:beta-galactosidase [Cohnella zeiphila]|uniref:beta-galactosidase n=1 Tax=Cohnella zeiphila TaxID=2761120 RepID=A0A7X0VVP5_9BACL|nr:beta-galactosidase [Cohnella zeiphila]MBB6730088.1 beta-galactosidase [Cohnella zeiphila]
MSLAGKKPIVRFGGDYNPEQWPAETLERDVALMKEAGVNTVTLNVFGWAAIEPEEGRYDFDRLDAAFDRLEREGIDVILATPTAAPPAWLFQREPALLKVGENGQRAVHWSRQAYCPNHPAYDREIRRIARVLAERYGSRSHLVLWHINNEYIVHCYCDHCAAAFREWLRAKYGTLERLNEAWQLSQWSLARTDWEQVTPPLGGMSHTSHSLDYQRFLSDSNLSNFLAEKEEIVRITPDIPVTTNFYSLDFRGQIHPQWAPYLDVISWDSYPPHRDHAVWAAFQHDYFRSLKRQPFLLMEQATGSVNWKEYNPAKRPGMMRLQSYQALARGAEAVLFFQFRQSRGGVEKFHSALVSHGTEADNRIYREVLGLGSELRELGAVLIGAERMEPASISRSALSTLITPASGRLESGESGAGLENAGREKAGEVQSRVAVLFDMTLTWLVDWNRPSRDVSYRETVTAFYRPLYEGNFAVDVIHPLDELSGYEVVVAPMLYMFEGGVPERLRQFVERGGTLVMSYGSGMVNGCDVAEHGGFLRPIDDVFGITVEEWDAFEPDMRNRIAWSGEGAAVGGGEDDRFGSREAASSAAVKEAGSSVGFLLPEAADERLGSWGMNPSYEAVKWAEVVRLKGAEALAVFREDYHAGQPAVTRHRYGRGEAYYVATHPEDAFLRELLPVICRRRGVTPWSLAESEGLSRAPEGVEIAVRGRGADRVWFVLNHRPLPVEVDIGPAGGWFDLLLRKPVSGTGLVLEGYGVAVLRQMTEESVR